MKKRSTSRKGASDEQILKELSKLPGDDKQPATEAEINAKKTQAKKEIEMRMSRKRVATEVKKHNAMTPPTRDRSGRDAKNERQNKAFEDLNHVDKILTHEIDQAMHGVGNALKIAFDNRWELQ